MAEWINDYEIVKPIHNLCKEKDIHYSELNNDQYEQYVYEHFNYIKSEEDAKTEALSTDELYELLENMAESNAECNAEQANEYALEGIESWNIPRRFNDDLYDLEVETIKRILHSRGD